MNDILAFKKCLRCRKIVTVIKLFPRLTFGICNCEDFSCFCEGLNFTFYGGGEDEFNFNHINRLWHLRLKK